MMEYPKIETLYERDDKTHKFKQPLTVRRKVYELLKSWQWTEKIDGTNIRVMWDHNAEPNPLTFGGKTDRASIPSELIKWLYAKVCADTLRSVFPESSAIIFGEGYGSGIQKGGFYCATQKFIVFDVFVCDPDNSKLGGWWLDHENVCDVAAKLELRVVPYLGEMTLEDATSLVKAGFPSKLGDGNAEGLVGRPSEPLFDKRGNRLIVKLKTRDW